MFEIVYHPLVVGIGQFDQIFSWGCLLFSMNVMVMYRKQVITLSQEYSVKLLELITERTELLIIPVVGFLIIQLLFLGLSFVLPIAQGSFLSTLLVLAGYAFSLIIAYILTRRAVIATET